MSQLLVLGVSHKTAPLEMRGRLALTSKQATRFARELTELEGIEEAVVVSTCNRTELYVGALDGPPSRRVKELSALLAYHAGIDDEQLGEIAYALEGDRVEHHLFSVTAGLDSMVLGENEIQGQVKRALETALSAGTTGTYTARLFSSALKAGKRVRTETRVASARTSVASVAVELAHKAVGPLAERDIVLIGAGETGELTARALAARGAKTIVIANRRVERAKEIAELVGATVEPLEDLPAQLAHADVVVSATASPHSVIETETVAAIMAQREHPLVLIDLAVPRDIEPGCRELAGVELYDIDDLQAVVDATFSLRESERTAAEEIIAQETERFARWLDRRQAVRADSVVELLSEGSADADRETSSA
ncbi:MAG TPA: glutamyl-tRNA reductase [Baekduia sp.]|nr:glutamyl-tRNA reductase [Baekduia sp.]